MHYQVSEEITMIDRAVELALLGCIPMRNTEYGGVRIIAPQANTLLAEYFDIWEIWPGSATPKYISAEWADMPLETVPDETYEAFLEAIRP